MKSRIDIVLNWEDMARNDKIKAEKERLSEILKNVPEQKIALCERLIERAAFMLVTLMDYEEAITKDGVITEMQQGDYVISRENPAAKGYNTMVKNYQALIRQLADILPEKGKDSETAEAVREAMNFIGKGRK